MINNESQNRKYFWINTKKDVWCFHEIRVGEEEDFLSESGGTKRLKQECFYNARVGDYFIGFQSTPTKRIVALGRISAVMEGLDYYDCDATITVQKYIDLENPVSIEALKEADLSDIPIVNKHQGTIFDITEDEFERILGVIIDHNPQILSSSYGLRGETAMERFENLSIERAVEISKQNGSYHLGWAIPKGSVYSRDQLREKLGLGGATGIRKSSRDLSVFLFDDASTGFQWSDSTEFSFRININDSLYDDVDWLDKDEHYPRILRESGLERRVHIMHDNSDSTYTYMGVATLVVDEISYDNDDENIFIFKGLLFDASSATEEEKILEKDSIALIEQEFEHIKEGRDREVLAKARVQHDDFKRRLLDRYHHSCCIEGCDVKGKKMLIASHIKPWSECDNGKEKTDTNNGLLLCPNHDHLFDRGFISFDMAGQIMLSEQLDEQNRIYMNVHPDMHIDITPQINVYMGYHRDNKFIRS